jgi:tetratricopeptide (TPR) repeat protein
LHGDLLDWVTLLVDQSLLQRREQPDGSLRYYLLETVREYGLEQLEACGELPGMRQQHATYVLDLSAQAARSLKAPHQASWLARIEAEMPNIRAALQWALLEGEIAFGLRLVTNLDDFWSVRGHTSEVFGWLSTLLQQVTDDGAEPSLPLMVRAQARLLAGDLANRLGDSRRAAEEGAAALYLYRGGEDAWGAARALSCLAEAERRLGELQRAITYYEQAVAQYEESYARNPEPRHILAIARALAEMSNAIACEQGNREATLLERIRTLVDSVSKIYRDAEVVLYQGHVRFYPGNMQRARMLYDECRLMAQAAGDRLRLGIAYNMLGEVAFRLGDLGAADAQFRESEPLRRALEDHSGLTFTLRNRAAVAYGLGDYSSASLLYQESLDLLDKMGDRRGTADVLRRAGDVMRAQGDMDQAAERYGECIAQARRLGDAGRIARGIDAIAGVCTATARWEQAARLFAAAHALREAQGCPPPVAELIDYLPSSAQPVDHALDLMAVRTALGTEAAFAGAWATGHYMPLAQVLSECLALAG